jgi:hypothetical protein
MTNREPKEGAWQDKGKQSEHAAYGAKRHPALEQQHDQLIALLSSKGGGYGYRNYSD